MTETHQNVHWSQSRMMSAMYSTLTFVLVARTLSISTARIASENSHELHDVSTNEYCISDESFSPKCWKNEVILMNRAVYGRMRIGRCLEAEGDVSEFNNDPRFLGCFSNVLHMLDHKCSGKSTCLVQNADLKKEKPCLASLKPYLEAEYECVAGSSSSSSKLSCGTKSQPWRLEAPTGQQINVSLLDFGVKTKEIDSLLPISCQQFGYVFDKSAKKNVSVCHLTHDRQKSVYISTSNTIELVLNTSSEIDERHFMIRLIAIGCSDLLPPIDSWLKRNGNEAVVGCYTSRQFWYLRCSHNEWVGVIGNCTREESQIDAFGKPESASSPIKQDGQVLVIVAVGFLALIVCLIVIVCGAVCLKRYYAKRAQSYCRKIEEIESCDRFHANAGNKLNGTTLLHAQNC